MKGLKNVTLTRTFTCVAVSKVYASPAVEWKDGKPTSTPMLDEQGKTLSRVFGLAPLVGDDLAVGCTLYIALEGKELPQLRPGQTVKIKGALRVWPQAEAGADRKRLSLGAKLVGVLVESENEFSLPDAPEA